MASIGDTLPYGIRIAPSQGGMNKAVVKMMVTPDGSSWKPVTGVMIAPSQGGISKKVYIGGGRLGDVDENGTIGTNDYARIRLYSMGLITLTQEQLYKADVNQDGVVNDTDASLVESYILSGGT